MPDDALEITQLLTDLGYDGRSSQARARRVLEEAKLTRPGKTRIDASKRPRLEELLRAHFLVTCGAPDCARTAAGREVLRAESMVHCQVCGGSTNRRAIQLARDTFAKKHVTRIVIVGGSPSVHDELQKLKPPEWDLRLVDGTGRRTLDLARADTKWAHVVVVWGSSELDHKVSELYTRDPDREHTVTVNKRGIAALLDAATIHVARRK